MLIIIQNDPEVPAGSYGEYLREQNIPFRVVIPYAGEELPSVAELSAAICFGGAMGVHDTAKYPFMLGVKGLIGECVRREKPFLGICLGGQLLADVLGGEVGSNQNGEKGSLTVSLTPAGEEDPLFAGIAQKFSTFQWHNDSFTIPPGGVRLAESAACPNQAFRVGKNAYGTQFHPEVDRAIVGSWARSTGETAPVVAAFLADFDQAQADYTKASRRLLANFLRIAYSTAKGGQSR